jgi:hypothetical protein
MPRGRPRQPGFGRYIEILCECDELPTGPIGLIDFAGLTEGLDEEQMEEYLLENGAGLRARTE